MKQLEMCTEANIELFMTTFFFKWQKPKLNLKFNKRSLLNKL